MGHRHGRFCVCDWGYVRRLGVCGRGGSAQSLHSDCTPAQLAVEVKPLRPIKRDCARKRRSLWAMARRPAEGIAASGWTTFPRQVGRCVRNTNHASSAKQRLCPWITRTVQGFLAPCDGALCKLRASWRELRRAHPELRSLRLAAAGFLNRVPGVSRSVQERSAGFPHFRRQRLLLRLCLSLGGVVLEAFAAGRW